MDEQMISIVTELLSGSIEPLTHALKDEVAIAAVDRFAARGLIEARSPEIEGWYDEVMHYLDRTYP